MRGSLFGIPPYAGGLRGCDPAMIWRSIIQELACRLYRSEFGRRRKLKHRLRESNVPLLWTRMSSLHLTKFCSQQKQDSGSGSSILTIKGDETLQEWSNPNRLAVCGTRLMQVRAVVSFKSSSGFTSALELARFYQGIKHRPAGSMSTHSQQRKTLYGKGLRRDTVCFSRRIEMAHAIDLAMMCLQCSGFM